MYIPPPRNRRSYTPVAQGSLPAIVMEFLSDRKGREYDDSPRPPYGKWYFYEQILKVPWYVIFDPEAGRLEVRHLSGGRYQEQTPHHNGLYWIDGLDLFLGLWDGRKEDVCRKTLWLRWWDADGELLPWQCELRQQAEREKQTAVIQTKQTIARQMLQAQADIEFIAQVTGLTEAEVLALK